MLGYLFANLLANLLPTRAEIDRKSYERSKNISFLRRLVALVFDMIGAIFFYLVIGSRILDLINLRETYFRAMLSIIIFLATTTSLTKGQTFGFFMTNLKVRLENETAATTTLSKFCHYFVRYAFFILQYLIIPLIGIKIIQILRLNNITDENTTIILTLSYVFIFFLYFMITVILVSIKKPLLYEKISKTKLENTVIDKTKEASKTDIQKKTPLED